ncbi:hypothetical protein P389DRAFT_55788 [Cystobasidium minutum MCA 4210]|uniref:uncharacterized protein n=1 Tax=Cystobasidium minutum MCA 4210 TaxID=1397322 RepID=UPI0034CFCE89|eukprot:jgi/Rhomi1/55788/CE55787_202
MSVAQKCPPDVLEAIFSLLDPFPGFDTENESFLSVMWDGRKPDLARCAAVCKAWSWSAQEVLYKHINLNGLHRFGPERLLSTLEKRGDLASLVISVHCSDFMMRGILADIVLKRLPNLAWYSLRHFDTPKYILLGLSRAVPGRSKLKMLALYGDLHEKPLSVAPTYFVGLTALEVLVLRRVRLPANRLVLPSLRKMIVYNHLDFKYDSLLECTNLRELKLIRPKSIPIGLFQIASAIRSLYISHIRFVWDVSDTAAFKNLECLTVRNGWIPPELYPSTLRRLTLINFDRKNVTHLMDSFSKIDFLPNLQEVPDLQLQSSSTFSAGIIYFANARVAQSIRAAARAFVLRGLKLRVKPIGEYFHLIITKYKMEEAMKELSQAAKENVCRIDRRLQEV